MTDTSAPVTMGEAERRAALAALAIGNTTPEPPTPTLARTGREVEAGGEVRRLLVKTASTLGWGDNRGNYHRAEAVPGDVIRVTQAQADRLDGLGVTVDPDADLTDVAALDDGVWTDEQIRAAGAVELVAYVTQNPDERPRVRTIEEARPSKGAGKPGFRVSVMSATEPTPVADEAALAEAAARQQTGPDAATVAQENQGNQAPGAGPSGAPEAPTK